MSSVAELFGDNEALIKISLVLVGVAWKGGDCPNYPSDGLAKSDQLASVKQVLTEVAMLRIRLK